MTAKPRQRSNGDGQYPAIEQVMQHFDYRQEALLETLHAAQENYGYLSPDVLTHVAARLNVPLADVHGVVEFYTMLYDRPVGKRVVRVCTDPACQMAGGEEVLAAACRHAGGIQPGETSRDGKVTVERATCLGLCDQAPAALVDAEALVDVKADAAKALLKGKGTPSRIRVSGEPRVMTRHIGQLDPTDLKAHRGQGTFAALEKALTSMTPEDVIEQVKVSRLAGRGGAGFPTGLKWEFTRRVQDAPKYVICNFDESEPGTFKDRALMQGDPFRALEGTILCAYAIGATQGYVFIRGEYPEATQVVQAAIDRLYEAGLLGANILGSDFSFDLSIRRGAGAYVCGEETALFEAIEGKRGFPRVKPPFPTTHGVFNKPTSINNVETLAIVPDIVVNGGVWWQQWGTERSTGLKLFCLSGHVKEPGVVEAPFGTTIRDLIENFGGGFDGTPQAILLGGAAGGFLHPDHLDTPLTNEDVMPLGAPIGSGVVMVFNENVDLRQVFKSLGHFFAHESCGKCYPCQLGTRRQLEILDRVADGQAQPGDAGRLALIGQTMTGASLCGLGQTAGAAVRSALALWPGLFEPNGH